MDMSEADGFCLSAASKLVDYLNEHHSSFEYRYMKSTSSYSLRWQAEVFSELDELDTYVDSEIGASKSKGLIASSGGWIVPSDRNGWRISN
jgi:hypothetical protein